MSASPPTVAAGPARRWLSVAAWVAGGLVLTVLFTRISQSSRVMSDGASIALQSWDYLHGHLRLHGWQVSDLNCYFVEIPLFALAEAIFGLGDLAQHVASGVIYALVALAAIAAAMSGSRGTARVVRCGVVLAVLAAPLFGGTGYLETQEPDHIGTTAVIIGLFMLVERYSGARFAALLLVLLTAAQFDDLTVRYVVLPAIVVIYGCRAIKARSLRSPDALKVYAALVSVPLTMLFSKVWVHFGGFITPPLWQGLLPPHRWLHNVPFVWQSILSMYGAHSIATAEVSWQLACFGLLCVFAAIVGLVRVVVRWPRATMTERMLAIAIVCNLAMFLPSGFATEDNAHEVALLLPAGAVLASRALVPARIASAVRAYTSATAVALVAVLALAYAAARPNYKAPMVPLVALLEAHHLTDGLSSYNEGATVSVLSKGKVHLIPVHRGYETIEPYTFESNKLWYAPSQPAATFAVGNASALGYPPSFFIKYFGKPVATYKVEGWTVLVYNRNLLRDLSRH